MIEFRQLWDYNDGDHCLYLTPTAFIHYDNEVGDTWLMVGFLFWLVAIRLFGSGIDYDDLP